MTDLLTLFINIFLKIFMIFTPFFVMSAFLSLTKDDSPAERHRIAVKVTLATALTCFTLFLFGTYIFALFGITLDAFRIGAGAVLFLSAVSMIQGKATVSRQDAKEDVSVVPLAIPITVGPGTIGALLVMGADLDSLPEKVTACLALLCCRPLGRRPAPRRRPPRALPRPAGPDHPHQTHRPLRLGHRRPDYLHRPQELPAVRGDMIRNSNSHLCWIDR